MHFQQYNILDKVLEKKNGYQCFLILCSVNLVKIQDIFQAYREIVKNVLKVVTNAMNTT